MANPTYCCYARPTDVKSYLGITSTTDDALILTLCERARAKIDTFCGRHFWPKVATLKHDAYEESQAKLFFYDDLITLSTLTNGDGNVILAADYFLYPQDGPPYRWIELDVSSGQAWLYQSTPQQAISIAGTWGWDERTADSGTTVNDAAGISATVTTITPASITAFNVGDMLKIESEYCYVTVVGASTLTVVRAINGSTGATHAKTTAIYFVRCSDDIMRIAVRLASWYYKQKDAPFEKTANPSMGVVVVPSALPEDIAMDLEVWRRWHV